MWRLVVVLLLLISGGVLSYFTHSFLVNQETYEFEAATSASQPVAIASSRRRGVRSDAGERLRRRKTAASSSRLSSSSAAGGPATISASFADTRGRFTAASPGAENYKLNHSARGAIPPDSQG